jgi:hypothetical protein
MKATHYKLRQEADRLAAAVNADPTASISKRKRVKDARKLELRVQSALDHGRLEEDVKGVKMEKVFSRASTKQAMIARVSLSFLCAPRVSKTPCSHLKFSHYISIDPSVMATMLLRIQFAFCFPNS